MVTDYKTGRAPSANWELRSLSGVRFYALLCQEVFGRLPAAIRLLYLSTGEIIEATPSEQAVRFVAARTAAVWKAVERACVTGDFKPRPTALCELCAFRRWCPAFGGDPRTRRRRSAARLRPRPGVRRPTFVDRFDDDAETRLEALRGNPVADAVFTTASKLGEFSLVWHATNLVRAAAGVGTARQVPVFAALVGCESIIVNQGIKRLFRRTRPTEAGDERYPVRRPTTSSFPSGHASSAAFAATVLSGWDGRRLAPLWWSMAGTVAVSRAYVRIHHASDVVAGLATGAVLGLAARRLLRRFGHA